MADKRRLLGGLTLRDCFHAPRTREEVFAQLPVLETPRLILRPLGMRDAQDVYEYSRDPLVAQHVLWDAHRSVSDTRAYLRYILRQYRDGAPSSYGIVLKETGKVVGTIGFMWVNHEYNTTEVGYSLARSLWNRGLMTEALDAVLSLCFGELNFHRVEAQHDAANPASGRVMLKCGMRYEGTLRSRIFMKGHYIDVALYAILREDWDALHTPYGLKETDHA